MQTVTQLLKDMADCIVAQGAELLLTHSSLKEVEETPGIVVIGFGTHSWKKLSVDGLRLQSRIREEYERFHAILKCLLRKQSSSVHTNLAQTNSTIQKLIDQQGGTYATSCNEAASQFKKAINMQFEMLSHLFDGAEGDHVYVPDTNGLIYNPQLEDWQFDDSPTFVLLLMPTVLSELDSLKVTGKSDSVRDKANKLVRQCMEYRRRGNLNDGVVLRKGSHSLRTIAVEPDFANSLPWLDPNNNDDRILAGFVEAMRQHPRCPVILVTRDINLTNKADYARLPCVLPPEPAVQPTK